MTMRIIAVLNVLCGLLNLAVGNWTLGIVSICLGASFYGWWREMEAHDRTRRQLRRYERSWLS